MMSERRNGGHELYATRRAIGIKLENIGRRQRIGATPHFAKTIELERMLDVQLELVVLIEAQAIHPRFQPSHRGHTATGHVQIVTAGRERRPIPDDHARYRQTDLANNLTQCLHAIANAFEPRTGDHNAIRRNLKHIRPVTERRTGPQSHLPLNLSGGHLPAASAYALDVVDKLTRKHGLRIIRTSLLHNRSRQRQRACSHQRLDIRRLRYDMPFQCWFLHHSSHISFRPLHRDRAFWPSGHDSRQRGQRTRLRSVPESGPGPTGIRRRGGA